ncbi:MAG: AAA family ATPase [Victivallaceae bacterium]
MATHISLRLAWHNDGWNGCVCKNPRSNTYCVGPYSYPSTSIADTRDLACEIQEAGKTVANCAAVPPCQFSINAFSSTPFTAFNEPPYFYKSGDMARWELPAYTASIWPYEEMFCEEDKIEGAKYYDNKKRLEKATNFFAEIETGKSLVFYYANYSNPVSSEDVKRYLLVGVARIKRIGDIRYYPNLREDEKDNLVGFVWQRDITSDYPNQGFRIPYHLYLNNPEVLERLAVFPDNDRFFKYATRHLSDDDALSLVERFIEVGRYLRDELNDRSENWSARLRWLESLFVELWKSRGLYPGFASVMEVLNLSSGVMAFKNAAACGAEKTFKGQVIEWLNNQTQALPNNWTLPSSSDANKIRRSWQLLGHEKQTLLSGTLSRVGLSTEQMCLILDDDKRKECAVESSLADIAANPFILCEEYQAQHPDDRISYSRIEHGAYPSPELGGEFMFDKDAWQRLRALTVMRLKVESQHTFQSRAQLIQEVNKYLSAQPCWKRVVFSEQYFNVDTDKYSQKLYFRTEDERHYIYLKSVYDAERKIETEIKKLATRAEITFTRPVTKETWKNFLSKTGSPIARASQYDEAIVAQSRVCDKIFRCPVSIVCGSAGTGKTTIVESIIKAIDRAHGTGTPFCLLAPTGKAADRLRDRTGKPATTIHAFLAQRKWLRRNMTFRSEGGQRESSITNYIIDECSMLDLELTAALFRAINWNSVQRLILVGDPNQLPPIGRGRVFADIIDYLRTNYPETVGELTVNLRQMENRIRGQGTGLLELASVFIKRTRNYPAQEEAKITVETVFKKLADMPDDGVFDTDLRVLYWKDTDDLHAKLIQTMMTDMETDSGVKADTNVLWRLRDSAWESGSDIANPEYQQIITPYRGEEFGTQILNELFQTTFLCKEVKRAGALAGIYLFDKVIQYKNRGISDKINAYNLQARKREDITVFNGEIGMVLPNTWDRNKWEDNGFRLKAFSVRFLRKENYAVGFDSNEKPEDNLELAYAISVHKAQGSEFERVYFVLPKSKAQLLSPELIYTGLTRAKRHCTLLIEEDNATLLRMSRPEASRLLGINSSLFDFHVVPDEFNDLKREGFLEQYRIHKTLADIMVRSKSEVIIANLLFDRDIPFFYEKPLYARDGSFFLPDFTINWHGEEYYWEHLGLLEQRKYRDHWAEKKAWYDVNFPGKLLTTEESGNLSKDAIAVVTRRFA